MLSGPTHRCTGFLILLRHLANLAKLSHEPSVDFLALVASIIQAMIAAVHPARDALDSVIRHALIGNGKQSILIEEPQRSLEGIFVSHQVWVCHNLRYAHVRRKRPIIIPPGELQETSANK